MAPATARFTIGRQIYHSTARPQRQQVDQNHEPAQRRRPFRMGLVPSWCLTRHGDWGLEPGGHDGPRWLTIHTDNGASVDIATVQNDDGDLVVWVDAKHGAMLTSERSPSSEGRVPWGGNPSQETACQFPALVHLHGIG